MKLDLLNMKLIPKHPQFFSILLFPYLSLPILPKAYFMILSRETLLIIANKTKVQTVDIKHQIIPGMW